MGILKTLLHQKKHILEGILFIILLVLGFTVYSGRQRQAFDEDLEKARKAAEAGNMKVVRELLVRYPGREEFVQLRRTCFEVIRSDYLPLNPDCETGTSPAPRSLR